MTLWMLRLPLDLNALAQFAAERGLMHPAGHDEGRALHHLLVETFGKVPVPGDEKEQKGAFQPFRVMASRGGTSLYGYSALSPDALRDHARISALPEALALLPLDRMEAKQMPEIWRERQILGFDLRTLPVVRLNSGIPAAPVPRGREWRAGSEVDAFLAHVLRHDPQGDPAAQETKREPLYRDWLAARLAPAAELLEGTRLARFRRIRVSRQQRAEVPEAVFHGSLRITDPDAFSRMLARGVGRHCAYGFGMLLLRTPGRPAPGR